MRTCVKHYEHAGITIVCRLSYDPATLAIHKVTPLLATLDDGHEVENETALALLLPPVREANWDRMLADVRAYDDALIANRREDMLFQDTVARLNGELV